MKSKIAVWVLLLSAVLIACSKDDNKAGVNQPVKEAETPELTEEEASGVLTEYQMMYRDVISDAEEDGQLTNYSSTETIKEELLTVLTEKYADTVISDFFQKEDDIVSTDPLKQPVWLDEELEYSLEQITEEEYALTQEQTASSNDLIQVTYVISWEEDKWRISDFYQQDVEDESTTVEQHEDNSNQSAEGSDSEDSNSYEANHSDEPATDETVTDDEEQTDRSDQDNDESTNQNEQEHVTEDDSAQIEDGSTISEENAQNLVKEYLNIPDDSELHVVVDHTDEEDDTYVVHVFEVVENENDSHTATLGWYVVDRQEGSVEESM
ncbi:hypothetical protein [Gracilibacillus timonensis]|uniref:hypothetical protein n=1 Tax=Gracilibacillus timonensis TaxID=1816696 RepID=UPI000826907A|nr:hypothetical protein [Gracilibacillus timonensis]